MDVDLDSAENRDLALRLARQAVVLLDNHDDALPLADGARLAVIGPLADDPYAMLGCYSFPAHVGVHHPDVGMGIEIPTVLESLSALHAGEIVHAEGCDAMAPGQDGFAAAVEAAARADVAVVVVGDRAGLFGRGTSGEGCDAADLRLPGEQHDLVAAVLATGTPVVLLVLSGRPYALGAFADGAAALLQTFFPGQLGGQAIAEVLTGAIDPSGRLPVGVPRDAGAQPGTYLAAPLGRHSGVSNIDPTPLYAFGHGIGYRRAEWGEASCASTDWPVDGEVELTIPVRNRTDREIHDVVQVYLHDVAAQVTRPEVRLVGFQRVTVPAGHQADVTFTVHADLSSFIGRDGERVVEPGEVELRVGRSSAQIHSVVALPMTGRLRAVGADRTLLASSRVTLAVPVGS